MHRGGIFPFLVVFFMMDYVLCIHHNFQYTHVSSDTCVTGKQTILIFNTNLLQLSHHFVHYYVFPFLNISEIYFNHKLLQKAKKKKSEKKRKVKPAFTIAQRTEQYMKKKHNLITV